MPLMTLKDGTNIYYEVLGSGPPVLLTPGGRSDMGRVRPMAEAVVAAGYQAILHDRRNCGRSDVVIERRFGADGKEYSEQELFVEDAYELVTNLGVKPVWSAGVSAGCRLSIMLAVRHSDAVKGLLLWRVSGGPIAAERLSYQYYGTFIEVAYKEGMEGVLRTPFFAERAEQNPANRERLLAMNPRLFISIMRDWQDFLLVNQPVAGATEEEMRTIRVPTMLVAGGDDIHPVSAAETLHRCVAGSEYHPPLWPREELDRIMQNQEEYDLKTFEGVRPLLLDFLARHEPVKTSVGA
jgi:pimeloyl-ACP methyl ester carboxylesterase